MDIDVQDTGSASGAPTHDHRSRRRLIGAGLVGLAGSLLPQFAARAGATVAPDESTGDTTGESAPVAATTTTAAPKRPTASDVDLLGFAQTVELSAVALYDIALAGDSLGDSRSLFVTLREAHLAYAQSISALLGKVAPDVSLDAAVDTFSDGFGGSTDDVLTAAYDLEATALATHQDLVGELTGTDGTAMIASILIAEARHCTVLAHLAGSTDLDTLLLTDAAALAPTKG